MIELNHRERKDFKYLLFISIAGCVLMVSSLVYYAINIRINTGGVFYSLVGFLVLLTLVGIFSVSFPLKVRKTVISRLFQKIVHSPILAIEFVFFCLFILWILYLSGIHNRYPFLGCQSFLYGFLLLFVTIILMLGYSLSLNHIFTSKIKNVIKAVFPFLDNHRTILIILIILIGIAYRNSLNGYLLKDDDLFIISWAQKGNPLITFIKQPAIYLRYYRPFQYIILWVSYQLFEFNYAGHQLFILIQHLFVGYLLYMFLYKITKERIFPLMAVLVFSVHLYVSSIVIWTSAVVSSLGLLIVSSLFFIYRSKITIRWLLGIGLLVFSGLFMHEMGFGLLIAVGLFVLFARYENQLNTRQLMQILAIIFVITTCYLILRTKSVGLFPDGENLSTGYFFKYYENPETLGIKLYVYTIAANIISNFFPIFSNVGIFDTSRILIITIGILLSFITSRVLKKCWENDKKYILSSSALVLILGFVLYKISGGINFALASSFQSILSICVFYFLTKWKKLSSTQKMVSVYALGLILGSSLVAFPYFRWRTHYPGVIGWVILLSMAVQYLKSNLDIGKPFYAIVISLTLIMIWGYSAELNSRLPRVTMDYVKYLCHPSLTDDFVEEVVAVYDIDSSFVDACREQ